MNDASADKISKQERATCKRYCSQLGYWNANMVEEEAIANRRPSEAHSGGSQGDGAFDGTQRDKLAGLVQRRHLNAPRLIELYQAKRKRIEDGMREARGMLQPGKLEGAEVEEWKTLLEDVVRLVEQDMPPASDADM